MALGVGGWDFYKKAFFDLDAATLSGPVMVKTFDRMRTLRRLSLRGPKGNWNGAAAAVARGEAGTLLLGDFVKNYFTKSGQEAGRDFLCRPAPGTAGTFLWLDDFFLMFKVKEPDRIAGQKLLARVMMDKNVQARFAKIKGSIPARLDAPTSDLDACTKAAIADLSSADKAGKARSAFSTIPSRVAGAMRDVVVKHFNSDQSSQEAAASLAREVESAR